MSDRTLANVILLTPYASMFLNVALYASSSSGSPSELDISGIVYIDDLHVIKKMF